MKLDVGKKLDIGSLLDTSKAKTKNPLTAQFDDKDFFTIDTAGLKTKTDAAADQVTEEGKRSARTLKGAILFAIDDIQTATKQAQEVLKLKGLGFSDLAESISSLSVEGFRQIAGELTALGPQGQKTLNDALHKAVVASTEVDIEGAFQAGIQDLNDQILKANTLTATAVAGFPLITAFLKSLPPDQFEAVAQFIKDKGTNGLKFIEDALAAKNAELNTALSNDKSTINNIISPFVKQGIDAIVGVAVKAAKGASASDTPDVFGLNKAIDSIKSTLASSTTQAEVAGNAIGTAFAQGVTAVAAGSTTAGTSVSASAAAGIANGSAAKAAVVEAAGLNLGLAFARGVASAAFSGVVNGAVLAAIVGNAMQAAAVGSSPLALTAGETTGRQFVFGVAVGLADVSTPIAAAASPMSTSFLGLVTTVSPIAQVAAGLITSAFANEITLQQAAALTAVANYSGPLGNALVNLGSSVSGSAQTAGITIGTAVGTGVVFGLAASIPNIQRQAQQTAEIVAQAIRDALGVHSPSQVTTDIGAQVGQGLVVGMASAVPALVAQAKLLAQTVASSIQDEINLQPGPDLSKVKGLVTPGNIDLAHRNVVHNKDGTVSTVRSMSFNEGNGETLIPTTAQDGSRILSDAEAIAQFHQSGQQLGVFDTVAHANAYAEQLHEFQDKFYAAEQAEFGSGIGRAISTAIEATRTKFRASGSQAALEVIAGIRQVVAAAQPAVSAAVAQAATPSPADVKSGLQTVGAAAVAAVSRAGAGVNPADQQRVDAAATAVKSALVVTPASVSAPIDQLLAAVQAGAVAAAPRVRLMGASSVFQFVAGFQGALAQSQPSIGTAISNGLAAGILGAQAQVRAAAQAVAAVAATAIRDQLGVKSPSQVTMAIGGHIGHGLALGISGEAARVTAAAAKLAAAAVPNVMAAAIPEIPLFLPAAMEQTSAGSPSPVVVSVPQPPAPPPAPPDPAIISELRALRAAVAAASIGTTVHALIEDKGHPPSRRARDTIREMRDIGRRGGP